MVQHGLRKWIDLNPDWNITIYDDNDVNEYIRTAPSQLTYDVARGPKAGTLIAVALTRALHCTIAARGTSL